MICSNFWILTYREEFRPSSILSGFRTGFDGLVMLLRHANLSKQKGSPKREKKEEEKEKERNRFLRFLLPVAIKSAITREFHFCTFSKRELARLASWLSTSRRGSSRQRGRPNAVSLIVPSNFLSPRLEKIKCAGNFWQWIIAQVCMVGCAVFQQESINDRFKIGTIGILLCATFVCPCFFLFFFFLSF